MKKIKCINEKTRLVKMVDESVVNKPWFKDSGFIPVNERGLKQPEQPVEVKVEEDFESEVDYLPEVFDEVEDLKKQIKSLTGTTPRTKDVEKLRTLLNDAQNGF